MDKIPAEITKGEMFVYKWQMSMLGHFFTLLANAMARADPGNSDKLMLAYPEEMAAMILFREEEGWWPDACVRIKERMDYEYPNAKRSPERSV
jgi:hypothetical protein